MMTCQEIRRKVFENLETFSNVDCIIESEYGIDNEIYVSIKIHSFHN